MFRIEADLDRLYADYNRSVNKLEKVMIINMIRLKEQQALANTMDESLQSLESDDDSEFESKSNKTKPKYIARKTKNNNSNDDNIKKLDELDKTIDDSLKAICKKQKNKIREEAYRELVENSTSGRNEEINRNNSHGRRRINVDNVDNADNADNAKDVDSLLNQRGRMEKVFQNEALSDPNYAKYLREDKMNNRLMERLNSEIDFRMHSDNNKRVIVKPFEENTTYDEYNDDDREDDYSDDDYNDDYDDDY